MSGRDGPTVQLNNYLQDKYQGTHMVDYALTKVDKDWKCVIKVYGETKGESGLVSTKLEAKNEAAAKVLAWFKATESGS